MQQSLDINIWHAVAWDIFAKIHVLEMNNDALRLLVAEILSESRYADKMRRDPKKLRATLVGRPGIALDMFMLYFCGPKKLELA